MKKIAFIVSHPVQYYVPLYRRLAAWDQVAVKVFYTWHAGKLTQLDRGFKKAVAWDIPLTDGYEFELVPNIAREPGTHHLLGLQNPELVRRVLAWRPDAVHITGYSFASHLRAIRSLSQRGVPVFFRGDSHLLNGHGAWWRWQVKRSLLRLIYRWPAAFLCVGRANKDYYRAFDVPESKLFDCPHSIETERFAEPDAELEQKAQTWRAEIGVGNHQKVVLFAGKFEDEKQPLPLMRAFLEAELKDVILVMVGDGELGPQVRDLGGKYSDRIRVLPFQNQSRMPLVYRLGDLLVLPSRSETWGLVVNEAMACGRPALVSDRVGCHPDMVRCGMNGDVFAAGNWLAFVQKLKAMVAKDWIVHRMEIRTWAANWSVEKTAVSMMGTIEKVLG